MEKGRGKGRRKKGRKVKKERKKLIYGFLTCEIVSNKRNTDVNEIIKPARHDGGTIISNDFDKFALKELISIKENVISKPCSGSGNQSRTKICKGKSERLGIISGHLTLPLRRCQLFTGRPHLVCSVVHEPESPKCWNGKGDAISPLCGQGRVRWIPTPMVKAK